MKLSNLPKVNKLLTELSSYHVKVGVLSNARYDSATSVASVLAYHEYGTVHMPRRSIVREPLILNKDKISSVVLNSLSKGNTVEVVFNTLALACESVAITAFDKMGYGKWKPLKPSTVKIKSTKKSSKTMLVDTGKLRSSIKAVASRSDK